MRVRLNSSKLRRETLAARASTHDGRRVVNRDKCVPRRASGENCRGMKGLKAVEACATVFRGDFVKFFCWGKQFLYWR
jgi:hypothetical protein